MTGAELVSVDYQLREKHLLIQETGLQKELERERNRAGRKGENLPLSTKIAKLVQGWWSLKSPRVANTVLGIELFDETRFIKKHLPLNYKFTGALRNLYIASKTYTLHNQKESHCTLLILDLSHVMEVGNILDKYLDATRNAESYLKQLEMPPKKLVKTPIIRNLLDGNMPA